MARIINRLRRHHKTARIQCYAKTAQGLVTFTL